MYDTKEYIEGQTGWPDSFNVYVDKLFNLYHSVG